tara:strand:- start:319 stop:1569 length:1251 start_codon:yes stop_codon:yes gene_type:complete
MKSPKCLFISTEVPYNPKSGGMQRTNHFHHLLKKIADVDTVVLRSLKDYSDEESILLNTSHKIVAFISLKPRIEFLANTLHKFRVGLFMPLCILIARIINAIFPEKAYYKCDNRVRAEFLNRVNIKDYDFIVGRYASSVAKLGLDKMSHEKIFIDVDDLHSEVIASRLEQKTDKCLNKLILKRMYSRLKFFEQSFYERIQYKWVSNKCNKEIHYLSDSTFLPNIAYQNIDAKEMHLPNIECQSIACIASFSHKPNIVGLDWFLNNVWTLISAQSSEIELNIYGPHLSPKLKKKWKAFKNINFKGFVDHISEAYHKSFLSICPTLYGGGTNIKVIEAAKYKRICLVTPYASKVLPEVSTSDYFICGNPNEFASRVLELSRSEGLLSRKTKMFIELFDQVPSLDDFGTILTETINSKL